MHVDMDAFFAAIEVLDEPALAGRALLIGHDGPRGVVATASYEARRYGCHSAQPMAEAKRRCPHAVIRPPRGRRYAEVSREVFGILESVTPLVEPLSIDEAFLDVTGSPIAGGEPVAIARHLKDRIRRELGLTCSIGLAPVKFLAKLASEVDKPDGLTVLRPEDVDRFLLALPLRKLWGIGPATEAKLAGLGIYNIAALRQVPAERLEAHLGSHGPWLRQLAHGIDPRQVTPDHEARSISQEHTFGRDVEQPQPVRDLLRRQTEAVADRLRRAGLLAAGVTVKLRYGRFQTITRSNTLEQPSDVTWVLWQSVAELFDRWAAVAFQPVRLIGVGAGPLLRAGAGQLTLFEDPLIEKQRRIDRAVDHIRNRYGPGAIHRGGRAEP